MIPDIVEENTANYASLSPTHESSLQKLKDKLYHHATPPHTRGHTSPSIETDRQRPKFLANAKTLPPPGLAHYTARRIWWLAPTNKPESPPTRSASHVRLERLLRKSSAVRSDEAWQDGVDTVWKGLMNGNRLRQRLPLNLVIKVIHAGWLRDPETWPEGAVAPESDEAFIGKIHDPDSPNAVAKFTIDNDRSDKQRTKIKDDGHLVPIHGQESSSTSPS
ncbi:hypothetical protein PAXRUDRAFT_822070 [Paxillus rubicundulus Ve08.2h10]|uniref:DUF4050 domain-containing protein n=1 Tax=Paxillus rubicundulus Ve08.2h10 TaxID=930991 RepID=A0A0D0ECV9_9AGAM|nr:hypothetical protein PAXRUDRAFT_822070 [Paxillus rubicundulus Ve08.2h10]